VVQLSAQVRLAIATECAWASPRRDRSGDWFVEVAETKQNWSQDEEHNGQDRDGDGDHGAVAADGVSPQSDERLGPSSGVAPAHHDECVRVRRISMQTSTSGSVRRLTRTRQPSDLI